MKLDYTLFTGSPIRDASSIGISRLFPNGSWETGDDPRDNPQFYEETVAEVLDGAPREVQEAEANRLVACWNACHGLDLPADVPPGTLADAVKALDEIGTLLAGHPEAKRGNSKVHFAMHRARAALAPFTADPAPPCCRKCGSPLKRGRCTDETCPFESHPQDANLDALYEPVPPVSPPVPDRYVLARYTGDEWEDDTDREGCRWIVVKWVIDSDEGNHWETAGGTRFGPDEVERPQPLPGLVSPPTVPDARYTVTVENTGRATPCHVARFCDDWIGRADTHEGAVALCNAAYAERMGDPVPPVSRPVNAFESDPLGNGKTPPL